MTKNRNNAGFSLAEMLIVVAIIIVLMGVAFVAVQNHQRSMTRLEFDSIAKEIFFAAQNHLTEAKSQGYLSESISYGHKGSTVAGDPTDAEIYYILSDDNSAINSLMLPRYAVDVAGTYIVRYQPSSAKVLDVFYSLPGKSSMLTVSGAKLGENSFSYELLMANCRGKDERANYNNAVVGWYGDEPAVEEGKRLKAPTFEVINEETLHVEITDNPDNAAITHIVKLIITGVKSGAEAYFPLSGTAVNLNSGRITSQDSHFSVLLDDITKSGKHFAEIIPAQSTKPFYPGEDIRVNVVAYTTDSLANVAMSAEKTTNSLFADPYPYTADELVRGSDIDQHVVGIENFRHLENLDRAVSKLGANSIETELKIEKAFQTDDLKWADFKSEYGAIVPLTGSTSEYWPVKPSYDSNNTEKVFPVSYDGQYHSISGVSVSHSGPAGLFGTLAIGSAVSNLELIDFDITGTTSAGALVGTAEGTTISNVVAHNSVDSTGKESLSKNIESTGSAGGLIGSMTGCTVQKSAAALYVTTTGTSDTSTAGGLIGTSNGGSVTACYSGGHTISGAVTGLNAKYDEPHEKVYPVRYDPENFNVTANSGTAGGLIGVAGDTKITSSYSTCSASGSTAGGFVGTASGTISNSYCTGLVSGTTAEGAFAASANGADETCKYYEIINERKAENGGYTYLTALSGSPDGSVKKIDESAASYAEFSGDPNTVWALALPYDAGGTDTVGLKAYYQIDGKPHYNFPTVDRLNKKVSGENHVEIKDDDFVKAPYAHYGDWPAPEEFIFN